MTHHFSTQTARALLAVGLVLGAATASVASDCSVPHAQETMVHPGMSMAEVQKVLGRAETRLKYHSETGETLIYHVDDLDQTHFFVQFDANGMVNSVGEYQDILGS